MQTRNFKNILFILLSFFKNILSYFHKSDCIYFFNLSTQAVCNTMSIFKWSLTGLDSKLSFSKTCYHTNVKEFSLPYYLHITRGKIVGAVNILKGNSTKARLFALLNVIYKRVVARKIN